MSAINEKRNAMQIKCNLIYLSQCVYANKINNKIPIYHLTLNIHAMRCDEYANRRSGSSFLL